MENKNEELQKMFCEMDETINVEELMEVKGGNMSEPVCGSGAINCSGGGGAYCISGVL